MKLFICTDHDSLWPVGVASIVIAPSESEASALLRAALANRGLDPDTGFTLLEVPIDTPIAMILNDGDY